MPLFSLLRLMETPGGVPLYKNGVLVGGQALIRSFLCCAIISGLTLHVPTITLSYAAFALAMGIGHVLLFAYARNPRAVRDDAPMHFWIDRVLQLGVLLLAAGTILGGVWANYS